MKKNITTKVINKNNHLQAQAFLRDMIGELFESELTHKHHSDIMEMRSFYIEHEEHVLIGAFDENQEIVGTIAVKTYIPRFESINHRYHNLKTGEIGRCYINKSQRRKGVGSLLLEHLMTFCKTRSYQKIYLHTHRHLPGGFEFWAKQGFEIVLEEMEEDIVHMELQT